MRRAELVVVDAGEEQVALVELHDEVVRVFAVGPDPHGHEDVVVELAQQRHRVDPAEERVCPTFDKGGLYRGDINSYVKGSVHVMF